jgi:hypothetical protein
LGAAAAAAVCCLLCFSKFETLVPPTSPAGDLKNIKGRVQHVADDGGVMVVPEDASLPDFKDAIRFEPREIAKHFEVGAVAA